nr:hypothetical protein [Tanacetum cinerariifolium]
MAWLDDEPIGDLYIIEDNVDNPSPQSTLQVLPSFEENTPPVAYLDEVEEIIGILMEVEPLHKPPLEDLGLNTYNHDIHLSPREVLSFDEMIEDDWKLGASMTLNYSSGPSSPPSYSLGSLRNAECSNCKLLLGKIK